MPLFDTQAFLSALGQTSVVIGVFFFTVLAISLVKRQFSYSRTIPYPPGPKSKPFIGNILDIPKTKPWVTYANWAKQYGSIVHLEDYSQHTIILSSVEDAVNLFEKRSNIYSDRPTSTMVKLMGWDFNGGIKPYGDEWRRHRRIFQQSFKKDVAISYEPIQTRKIHDMLRNILDTPDNFIMHYKTVAAAIIMSSVYGHDISPTNDYFVSLSEQAVAKLSGALFPGAVAVNVLPILQHIPSWFPGAGFQRYAAEARDLTDRMQNVPFNSVRKNMSQGIAPPSMLAGLLEANDVRGGSKEVEDDIKAVCATSYAGADTTASATGTFFQAMACYPHAQQKAQQEIDNLTDGQRLPNYTDRSSLPYVEALFREVMRWRPVLPLGVAHAASDDDIYNGYYIPKGATVISNIWAMLHDSSVYTNPGAFIPERFINDDGELNDDDTILAFGFGRRICVGRHMASSTVWLIIASMLAAYNIRKAKDESGQEISIPGDYTDAVISQPLPFRCSITPRSEEMIKLILETKGK